MKYFGRDLKVGIGKETTRGTAVSPSFWLPVIDFDFEDKKEEVIKEETLGVIEEAVGSIVVSRWAEGSLKTYLKDRSIGLILLALLGQVSTETDTPEAGVNTHTFTVKQDHQHPSLTICRKIGDLEQIAFPLAMIKDFELSGEVNKILEASVSFISKKSESMSLTPSFESENEFLAKHVKIKFADNLSGLDSADAIEAKNFSLKIDKDLEKDDVLGQDTPKDILNKVFKIDVEVGMLLQNLDYANWAKGTNYKAMRIEIENDDVVIGSSSHPKLVIDLARVRPVEYSRDFSLGDFIKETLSLKGYYSISDAKSIEVKLINTESSY